MLAQDDEARRQLGIAAAQGDSEAQFRLGAWHLSQGDFAEARRLFGLASAQGEAQAQVGLGVMHYGGQGGPKDFAEARRLFGLAEIKRSCVLASTWLELWG